jgi:hypothetical protein
MLSIGDVLGSVNGDTLTIQVFLGSKKLSLNELRGML